MARGETIDSITAACYKVPRPGRAGSSDLEGHVLTVPAAFVSGNQAGPAPTSAWSFMEALVSGGQRLYQYGGQDWANCRGVNERNYLGLWYVVPK